MAVWFGEGIEFIESTTDRSLTIIVPTSFFRDRILSRFHANLREAIQAVHGHDNWRVLVVLPSEIQADNPPVESAPILEASSNESPNTAPDADSFSLTPPTPASRKSKSNPTGSQKSQWPTDKREAQTGNVPGLFGPAPVKATRRLDNFIVGPCNRMAHTAALEMIKSRGTSFNPLVLHGGVGLGKTHLLDGLAHAMRTNPTGGRLIQISAEAFTNAFLEALRTGQLASFRNRFRNAAALIIDDIHFIASKRATQSEFLHTFNALIAEDVPIILSCDQHPKRVNKLMEELSTRFMAGMVVRLDTPDPEVRRMILRAKAAARGVELPDNVIDTLGEHLRVSVRELEGALNSLIAHSVLTGRRVDLELARMVMRDSIRHTVQAIGLHDVETSVCTVFSLTHEQLHSKKTSQSISIPRTIAMYLSRRHTPFSYSEIARHYGLKNHSSVIAAEKRVKQWLEENVKARAIGGFETMGDMLAAVQTALGV
jgi:chromosomal replication initiator protein